jgi:hypothetical protein
MAITTLDGWIAAAKQRVEFTKTTSRTTVALIPFSVFDLAGTPGAGALSGSNTANGVVPTDLMNGSPVINAFSGANKGYIGGVEFTNTVASRLELHDMLFKAGAYAFNANVSLASQPSYASRVPGGTDFKGTEIWLECVTAFTGNQTIAITYTNQDGTAGRTTGTIATGIAPIVGRMYRMPLQAGDTGVQKIESVVSTVSTVGTFNVLVTRQLWAGRVGLANGGDFHDFIKTGMPEVFADSALMLIVQADSTASGIPSVQFDIVNG